MLAYYGDELKQKSSDTVTFDINSSFIEICGAPTCAILGSRYVYNVMHLILSGIYFFSKTCLFVSYSLFPHCQNENEYC